MTVLSRVIAAAAILLATPSFAGDSATVNVLGFSEDGSLFAFEEYGMQDGSGFPYANRFYIRTATDQFAPGTPIRVRIEDEGAPVAQARQQARQQGQKIIDEAVLEANEGFAAGSNGLGELSTDMSRMAANPRPIFSPVDPPLEFRIEELTLEQPAGCQDLGEAKGFRLIRIRAEPGGATETIHEDTSIPASRDCPLGYGIAGIQTYFTDSGTSVFAVLIAVRKVGFEGPDHRYIAVTGRM